MAMLMHTSTRQSSKHWGGGHLLSSFPPKLLGHVPPPVTAPMQSCSRWQRTMGQPLYERYVSHGNTISHFHLIVHYVSGWIFLSELYYNSAPLPFETKINRLRHTVKTTTGSFQVIPISSFCFIVLTYTHTSRQIDAISLPPFYVVGTINKLCGRPPQYAPSASCLLPLA